MSYGTPLRIRRSITDLQDDYTKGSKKPLEDVIKKVWTDTNAPVADAHQELVVLFFQNHRDLFALALLVDHRPGAEQRTSRARQMLETGRWT